MSVVAGILLLAASSGAAEPGTGITTTVPSRESLEARPPGDTRPRPIPARPLVREPLSHDGPVFIGPTMRSETSELGVAAWTAPAIRVGGLRASGGEDNGSVSFGLTYTWGQHPSAGRVIR